MDEENATRLDIQNFLIVTAKSFLPNALVDEVFQLARNVVTKTTRKGSADFTCKAFVSLFATLKRIATSEREGEEKEEENESAIREALLKSWKASKNEISTTTTTATTTDNDDDDESKEDERNAKEKTAVLGEKLSPVLSSQSRRVRCTCACTVSGNRVRFGSEERIRR